MTTCPSELRCELDLFLGTGQWFEEVTSDREGQRCATQTNPQPGQTLRAYFNAGGELVAMTVKLGTADLVEVPAPVLLRMVATIRGDTHGTPSHSTARR